MHGVTYVVGMRFRDKFVLLIAALYVFAHLLMWIAIDLVMITFEGEFVGRQARIGGIFIYSLIIAPSMRYMALFFVVFYINVMQCIFRHTPADERDGYLIVWPLMSIMVFTFWFIF